MNRRRRHQKTFAIGAFATRAVIVDVAEIHVIDGGRGGGNRAIATEVVTGGEGGRFLGGEVDPIHRSSRIGCIGC